MFLRYGFSLCRRHGGIGCVFPECVAVKVELQIGNLCVRAVIIIYRHGAGELAGVLVVNTKYFESKSPHGHYRKHGKFGQLLSDFMRTEHRRFR